MTSEEWRLKRLCSTRKKKVMKKFIVIKDNGIGQDLTEQFKTIEEAKAYVEKQTKYYKDRDCEVKFYIYKSTEQ